MSPFAPRTHFCLHITSVSPTFSRDAKSSKRSAVPNRSERADVSPPCPRDVTEPDGVIWHGRTARTRGTHIQRRGGTVRGAHRCGSGISGATGGRFGPPVLLESMCSFLICGCWSLMGTMMKEECSSVHSSFGNGRAGPPSVSLPGVGGAGRARICSHSASVMKSHRWVRCVDSARSLRLT